MATAPKISFAEELAQSIAGDDGVEVGGVLGMHDRIVDTASRLLAGRMAAAAHSDASDAKWLTNETGNAVRAAIELHRVVARALKG
jgi:hypothetical protein